MLVYFVWHEMYGMEFRRMKEFVSLPFWGGASKLGAETWAGVFRVVWATFGRCKSVGQNEQVWVIGKYLKPTSSVLVLLRARDVLF